MQANREAVGIDLRGSVVVVDEAHNLVDAVGRAHSAQVSISQLQASKAQLSAYLTHFRQRLSASEHPPPLPFFLLSLLPPTSHVTSTP